MKLVSVLELSTKSVSLSAAKTKAAITPVNGRIHVWCARCVGRLYNVPHYNDPLIVGVIKL